MNLALFDFDGTITHKATFVDFMRFATPPRRLAIGRIVLTPVALGYRLGLVSGNTIRSCAVNFGFRDMPAGHIQDAGRRFAKDVLPGLMRPLALERIRWHQAQGDTVVIVSGALDVFLAPWCEQQQIGLLCSELEVEQGRLTGRYRGAQCVGAEKVRRIHERYCVGDFARLYAYGDTKNDLAMLELADQRYFCWREMA